MSNQDLEPSEATFARPAYSTRTVDLTDVTKLSDESSLSALEEFLGVASRLNSAISDLPIFADHGIGPANWALLKVLESGPASTDQLAQRANLSRQRVGVQVKELEVKKFLAVTRLDDGDRRSRVVHILPHGTETLRDISFWLSSLSGRDKSKKLLNATKQMRVLQRLFLQEKRARAGAARLQKRLGGNVTAGGEE